MALNTRSVIHPKFFEHNRQIDKDFMLATIEIFDPNATDSTYDAATNSWTSARDILWTGKARIQPSKDATNKQFSLNPTTVQEVEVHIDFEGNTLAGYEGTMPDIRPGHQIFVTSSPYDDILENFILVVRSAMNSSNPWHRAILCEVDQEVERGV